MAAQNSQDAPQGLPGDFEALETLRDAPERIRRRYGRLAKSALRQRAAAMKLKCLECCAWDYPEAKRCQIRGCALWELTARGFGRAR